MGCPPVRGDNPRALASGSSYVQADKHVITIYTTYISVDLAHHEIFRAKVVKGCIIFCIGYRIYTLLERKTFHLITLLAISMAEC